MTRPLTAHRGFDAYAPTPGGHVRGIFHYCDGPLSGTIAAAGSGEVWTFECLEQGGSALRMWRYHPLRRGASDRDALAVIDALWDGRGVESVPQDVGPATYSISDGATIRCALVATDAVDVKTFRQAVRGGLPLPDGVIDLDTDIFIASLVRIRAEPEVIEAARRLLATRPDCYVADPDESAAPRR